MKLSDVERIMKRIPGEEIENPEKLPLLLEIINWAADAMLSRILGVLGFDDDVTGALWNFASMMWDKLLLKAFPGDPQFERYESEYRRRYEAALKAYLQGHPGLWDALVKDILGIKEE